MGGRRSAVNDEAVAQLCAKLDALAARVDEIHAKVDAMATAEEIITRTEKRREGRPARSRQRQLTVIPAHPGPGRHLHVVRGEQVDR